MDKIQIWRDGKLFTAKPGLTLSDLKNAGYFEKHPGAIVCKKQPSITTMRKWVSTDSSSRAIDGCKCDMDGNCPHGLPSWLIALHMV